MSAEITPVDQAIAEMKLDISSGSDRGIMGRRPLTERQFAEYGYMIGGLLVRTVVAYHESLLEEDPRTALDDTEAATSLLKLAHYLGETSDRESNAKLIEIFGSEYINSAQLARETLDHIVNPYWTSLPRPVTQEDEEQALSMDETIVKHGVTYLKSEEAAQKIWNRISSAREELTNGCPLIFLDGKDGIPTFDKELLRLLDWYKSNDPRFTLLVTHGPTDLSLDYIRKFTGYSGRDDGFYKWKLPGLYGGFSTEKTDLDNDDF